MIREDRQTNNKNEQKNVGVEKFFLSNIRCRENFENKNTAWEKFIEQFYFIVVEMYVLNCIFVTTFTFLLHLTIANEEIKDRSNLENNEIHEETHNLWFGKSHHISQNWTRKSSLMNFISFQNMKTQSSKKS